MDAGERQHLVDQIHKVLSGSEKLLVNNLHQLDVGCREFEKFYAEYDLNRTTPANGFRSFCKVIGIMVQNIAVICTSNSISKSESKLLKEYSTLSNLFCKQLELGRMIRSKGVDYSYCKSTELDRKIILKANFTQTEIAPFYGNVGFFNLRKDFQKEWQNVIYTTHYMGMPTAWQKVKFLASKSYAARMILIHSTAPTVEFVRRAIDISQFPINVFFRWNSHKGMTFKWVEVPVEVNRHTILLSDMKTPAYLAEKYRSVRTVKCLYIQPNEMRSGEMIVLHSHGGAFLGGSTKSEAPVSADRVAALGVPFILPEYALSPEHPYPAAIQDVMDVYMFLVSESPRVADMIGFQPKKVLLSGSSAGGTISLATLFALNAIRKRGHSNSTINLKMPCGVHLQFPGTLIGFIPTPSSIVFDFMCTPRMTLLSASFYAEADPRLTDDLWVGRRNAKDIMKRFYERSQDPLFNPMAFKDWDDLKDIPLAVLACEMDTLLDHSVILCKKWAGATFFDLAIGMPHGFINNPKLNTKNDSRLVMIRMAQLLKIKI